MGDRTANMGTLIPQSTIDRVVAGVKYWVRERANAWFGPFEPLTPVAQEQTRGRQFDYPVGYNINIQPRANEPITFPMMRALADNCDLLRIILETRKDQLLKFKFTIQLKDEKAKATTEQLRRIAELEDFFAYPDREHAYDTWLRMLLEDMLVIDAATIYPRPTVGGGVYAFEIVDGATIKRVINEDGRTPLPPDPAYQQILKGVPACDYSKDELVYAPRNLRSARLYGFSPVEQVIFTTNIAIRRDISILNYYTEGNVPEALCGVPDAWTSDQMKDFQLYFDALLSGNLEQRRRMLFVPGDIAKNYKPTREATLKDEYDEWLARKLCFALSISPTPFIKQMNRATAETQKEEAREEGLVPLMRWVKVTMDLLLHRYLRQPDLQFAWQDEDAIDPLEQAQIEESRVKTGIQSIDEIRQNNGWPAIGMGNAVLTPQGYVPLKGNQPLLAGRTVKVVSPGGLKKKSPDMRTIRTIHDRTLPALPRSRPVTRSAERRLRALLARIFRASAKPAAEALARALHVKKLAKAGKEKLSDAQVKRTLTNLKLKGWDAIATEVEPELGQVAKDGAAQALAQVKVSDADVTKQAPEDAIAWAEERAAELVGRGRDEATALTDSTRELLQRDIAASLEAGESQAQLIDRLRDSYAFSEARAAVIARTEVARAHVQGNLIGWRASGVVRGKISLLADDHPEGSDCDCADNAAQGEIPLEETFDSGDDGPPYHPNCECDLEPVLSEDSEEDEAS